MSRDEINKITEQRKEKLSDINGTIESLENELQVLYAERTSCHAFLEYLASREEVASMTPKEPKRY